MASDHKIDLLIGQVQALSGVVAETRANTATVVEEVKADSKLTRSTVIVAAIASVIAVLGLMVTLWIAGINIQANMIAIFQAGLGVRTLSVESEPPRNPPPGTSQSPMPPASPAGK